MRKRFALGVLVLMVFAVSAVAEEVTGTILFDPQRDGRGYRYSISTGTNNRVADKTLWMGYDNVGSASQTLTNYLVKGAKIVYENGGIPEWDLAPMRNTMGESIGPMRLIAIIMEDGYYMELTEILTPGEIGRYFRALNNKLNSEGR